MKGVCCQQTSHSKSHRNFSAIFGKFPVFLKIYTNKRLKLKKNILRKGRYAAEDYPFSKEANKIQSHFIKTYGNPQWDDPRVRDLAAKPHGLSSIPGTSLVEEKHWPSEVALLLLYTHSLARKHPHTCTHKCNFTQLM